MQMALADLPLMGMIKEKMGWLTARQEVLARNVANADTPGYAARDLERPDFRSLMAETAPGSGASLRQTRARHMDVGHGGGDARERHASGWEVVPDGNAVSAEREMLRVTETVGEYRLAANLYAKSVGLIRTAIGRQ